MGFRRRRGSLYDTTGECLFNLVAGAHCNSGGIRSANLELVFSNGLKFLFSFELIGIFRPYKWEIS